MMRTQRVLLFLVLLPFARAALSEETTTLVAWTFERETQWNGWLPNAGIVQTRFADDHVVFLTQGSDPQILSPQFEVQRATNDQWVEIDLDCEASGRGELFYTNKTTGQYGGLEPAWRVEVTVPFPGRHTLRVWPFWESLGRIIRLRFDPPAGMRCRLYAVRIVASRGTGPAPCWSFADSPSSWQSMYAVRINHADGRLLARAQRPQAVMITRVEPFDAARRSILRMDAACAGEDLVGLYWITREAPGLYGEPIKLTKGRRSIDESFDLRQFTAWNGTVTHLAIAFGTFGTETLALRSLSIEKNDPARPFLRLRYLGFKRAINRPGKPAVVRVLLQHAAGPPLPSCTARVTTDDAAACAVPALSVPALAPGGSCEIRPVLTPRRPGRTKVKLDVNGQVLFTSLRIDPPVPPFDQIEYDVPPPRPVTTNYQIGVYYFPGWSPDQLDRWKKQAGFPEREPALGWYAEGRPEVADWHITWAIENGISFFVYDWYWLNGEETLGAALNKGFLKARYCDQMQFALMWANHKPFAAHTTGQLLRVTDYWIARYFHRPNYLTYDGKPYVSFFSPGELIACLGSEEAVRAAFDAMRKRVRAAGLSGLHVGACSGPDRPPVPSLQAAGFDSITAYNYLRTGATMRHSAYRQFLLGHEHIWKALHRSSALPYIPLLTVGWDSRPWHGIRAERKFARRTRDFAEALGRLKAHLDATGRRMALLEAWNEWGEGSYLEPNVTYGFEDLEAVRSTFAVPGAWPVNRGPDDAGRAGAYDLRR